jgi:hypothetical protein
VIDSFCVVYNPLNYGKGSVVANGSASGFYLRNFFILFHIWRGGCSFTLVICSYLFISVHIFSGKWKNGYKSKKSQPLWDWDKELTADLP